ncbi:MAG: hypothetical protein IJT59_04465 [Desulfovibrionaceae bacterium]|nr:hypothetical protein [Desulfovibrionaceae bacterium]
MPQANSLNNKSYLVRGLLFGLITFALALILRLGEWSAWQDPEFRLGQEWLLATHDAYHWVAGAENFGLANDHPMALMLKGLAASLNTEPANVAFWFPMILASLVSVIVFLWVWALGSMEAGIAAGLITSISPGFLARTLLGFYDTDLVTLFFPLLITLIPATWAMRYMILPHKVLKKMHFFAGSKKEANTDQVQEAHPSKNTSSFLNPKSNPLHWGWILLLTISGIVSWWTQAWHSVFPYLIRYNCLLLGALAIFMAKKHKRGLFLLGALAYAWPTLLGPWASPLALILIIANHPKCRALLRLLTHPIVLTLATLSVLGLTVQGDIYTTILNHINAYVKQSADTKEALAVSLAYPSVAQSIVEVQDLNFATLLSYFHPWPEAAFLGLMAFGIVVILRPGALFLFPLAALALLSTKLGGRMVMFGAPIIGIGLSLPLYWFLERVVRSKLRGMWAGILTSLLLIAVLILPFIDLIPAMSQGPMINRRHAECLRRAQDITPKDALLWVWWDWGYAAHHFAKRQTICDGAQHAGPSLYLPAAVFATDNPRFARQLIRYTAQKGNEAGNVLAGLGPLEAQALIEKLHSPKTPLIKTKERIFILTSFEMLRLGFWISNFGSWNFVGQKSEGGALSIVPQSLSYRLDTGEVRLEDGLNSVYAASISVFEETGITRKNYVEEWFRTHQKATLKEQQDFLNKRRNVHFLFNKVTGEKIAVDERIAHSLMIRLLTSNPQDSSLSPYFKLVYDNVFARIYEVL